MTVVDALQGALATEHAVIWGYGVVGADVAADRKSQVAAAEEQHRLRRDEAAATLRTLGVQPVVAQPSYRLPTAVDDPVSALTAAALMEDSDAAAWRFVLGSTDDPTLRTSALDALVGAAVQAVRWRTVAGISPATTAFPGQPR